MMWLVYVLMGALFVYLAHEFVTARFDGDDNDGPKFI